MYSGLLKMRQFKIQVLEDSMSRESLLPSPETEVFALIVSLGEGMGHSPKLS